MAKRRADQLAFEQGLAPTRSKAQALILAGAVLAADDRRVEKPGEMIDDSTALRLKGQVLKYVSRGGNKLEAALEHFDVDVAQRVCLDVGVSTGGFTDCLLQNGARRVYAVDVGYGQIDWRLRSDERVVLHERTNIRHMDPESVSEPCSLIVIDVSFISLKLVIEPALRFAAAECCVVALVKPQFEVGRADVGKGGIVRDDNARQRALEEVKVAFTNEGLTCVGSIDSPILGAKGNKEFLLLAKREGPNSQSA